MSTARPQWRAVCRPAALSCIRCDRLAQPHMDVTNRRRGAGPVACRSGGLLVRMLLVAVTVARICLHRRHRPPVLAAAHVCCSHHCCRVVDGWAVGVGRRARNNGDERSLRFDCCFLCRPGSRRSLRLLHCSWSTIDNRTGVKEGGSQEQLLSCSHGQRRSSTTSSDSQSAARAASIQLPATLHSPFTAPSRSRPPFSSSPCEAAAA